jgi:hydroxymethylpyrimidine pyrophosphatase-like HAD family hydrolase
MKDIVIFDIDGTLANGEHRQQYVREKPKNWPRYNDLMSQDTVHEHVRRTYWSLLNSDFLLYIVSGREDRFREVTEKWLLDNDITRLCWPLYA